MKPNEIERVEVQLLLEAVYRRSFVFALVLWWDDLTAYGSSKKVTLVIY